MSRESPGSGPSNLKTILSIGAFRHQIRDHFGGTDLSLSLLSGRLSPIGQILNCSGPPPIGGFDRKSNIVGIPTDSEHLSFEDNPACYSPYVSRGPGILQSKAIEMAADGISLISGGHVAHDVFGSAPTDSQLRSSRRALQQLSTSGKITCHGWDGWGRKIYGGPLAQEIQSRRAYAQAMMETFGRK